MPQRKSRIPSYCLHKASGKAVVRIDGCDHYLGEFGTDESRRKYDCLLSEWLARRHVRHEFAEQTPNVDLTINQLLAQYHVFAKGYYVKDGVPTKELSNLEYAMKPLAKLFGQTLVREFGPIRLKAVRDSMVASDIARTLANERVNRLRRIFRWGVENQIVLPEVLHALEAVSPLKRGRCEARETDPVKPVSDEHVEAVLKVVPPTLAAMIRVQWFSGMRPGEIVIMRPCDIKMEGDVWSYRPEHHKTEHFGIERVIPIGPQAQGLLMKILPHDIQAYVFSPKSVMAERYAVRPNHRRRPNKFRKSGRKLQERYTTQSYGRAVAYACEVAGIPLWSPNQLRHSAATRLRKQFGLDVAQVVLGHKTAKITQVYAELDQAKAAQAMKKSG